MKICHIFSNFYPFASGGVERQIQLISSFLSNYDSNLHFSLITDRNCLLPALHENITKFQSYRDLSVFRLGPNIAEFVKAFLDRAELAAGIKKIHRVKVLQEIREQQLFFECSKIADLKSTDIFHLHGLWGTVYEPLALRLSRFFGKPLIVHLRGTYISGAEAMPPLDGVGKAILEHASVIITHNTNVFKTLKEEKYDNKSQLIPNGVDIDKFRFSKRDYNKKGTDIAFIGRLSSIRDPIAAVQAFNLLLKKIPDAKLHIVGGGDLENNVEHLIRELGIHKSAILYGPRNDVSCILSKCDVFWATSQITNWPSNSLMEALASGLPVVATDTGLTQELIIDKYNGLLVSSGNLEELAASTEAIFSEEPLRKNLSINARTTAEKNDVKLFYPKIAQIYYSLSKR